VSLSPEALISKSEALAASGDFEGAVSVATALLARYPKEVKAWSLLAYLHARVHDYLGAISDVSHAIDVAPREPKLFFDRGRYYLRLEQYRIASEDFSRGLELCDLESNDYYRESLLFMRAEALIQLGRTKDALADLARVRDDFAMWTFRLATKQGLMGECGRRR
jgi:tetratricopeptide (TPR) repeat protein